MLKPLALSGVSLLALCVTAQAQQVPRPMNAPSPLVAGNALCGASNPQAPKDCGTPPFSTFDTVAALNSATIPSTVNHISLASYYGLGTQGGGNLSRASCTADGVSCFSSVGATWLRDDFKHLTIADAGCTTSMANCNSQIAALFSAISGLGYSKTAYGDCLHFTLSASATPPAYVTFDEGGQGPLPSSTSAWSALPCTIELDESASAITLNTSVGGGWKGAHVLNKAVNGITNTSTLRQNLDAQRAFETNSPTAVTAGQRGSVLKDLDVIGFSRCFDLENSPDLIADNLTGQCGNRGGIWTANNHDIEYLGKFQLENTLFKNSANRSGSWSISAITSYTGNLCQYTFGSSTILTTHDRLNIFNVPGPCGGWIPDLTVIDATHAVAPAKSTAPVSVAVTWEITGRNAYYAAGGLTGVAVGSVVSASTVSAIPVGTVVTWISNPKSPNNLFGLSVAPPTFPVSGTLTFSPPTYSGGGTAIADAGIVDGVGFHSDSNDGITLTDSGLILGYRTSIEIDHDTSWPKTVCVRDDAGGAQMDRDSVSVYVHGSGNSAVQMGCATLKSHSKAIVFDSPDGTVSHIDGSIGADNNLPGGMIDISQGALILGPGGSISVGDSTIGSAINYLGIDHVYNPGQTFHYQTAATASAVHGEGVFSASSEVTGKVQNSEIQNPTVTVAGHPVALGGSTTLAFSDLTGSVAPSQLPNPTSSTLGGVQAKAPITSQWINSISTSGVPTSSQPTASDISGLAAVATSGSASDLGSGTVAAARLNPSIGSNLFLGNNTVGPANASFVQPKCTNLSDSVFSCKTVPDQPHGAGCNQTIATASTVYLQWEGNCATATLTNGIAGWPVSHAGVFEHLYVVWDGAPGASATYTITFWKNGSATSLTCVVSGASATTCNDLTDAPSVAAGDIIDWQIVTSSGAAAHRPQIGFDFRPTS